MLIKRKSPLNIKPSEITDKSVYLARRKFMREAAVLSAAAAVTPGLFAPGRAQAGEKLAGVVKSTYSTDEELNSLEDITSYNNFYELGTHKRDPARNADRLKTKPWSLLVEGECDKPGTYDLEDIIKPHQLEERIYRLRCVEAWSMVVPWVGFPLADVIKRFEPTANARYVAFETIYDPENLPGQVRPVLGWPYVEGLRMDEAMNPLTIFAVGLYGEVLPNQNGAPIRLVVPWKYGFKSIKSIVKMSFTEDEPPTSWNKSAAREYGFYSNVNPQVSHPRWSQRRERRIGELFKRETLMFNGYAEQVAHLYDGMDLKKFF
ncbi:MAG: protein-methionine-sulfoxide reductase catalytic subunit MsrP [Gammaproteobacteria bacterium]